MDGDLFQPTGDIDIHPAAIALGDKQRIPRGDMELPHVRRRDRVIDTNKRKQDASWAREKEYNATAIDLLEGRPVGTKVRDVMPTTTTAAAA